MANSMPKPLAKSKANNEPYRKVKITMWDDPRFRALSPLPPSGQSLFIYLLTGPFTGIIPGLFKAGRAALAEELGWDVEAFDLALGEALSLGMVKADIQARVFWLPNAAKHNPPTSVNVIKSWVRAFELLPECDLKYEALESLKAASHGVSQAMGSAFDKAFSLANPLATDKPKPLPRGIQKAVSSKQILNPTHNARGREEDGQPSGDSALPEFVDETWPDDPAVKKPMTADWQPSPDFRQRAALWNVHLPATGWEQHELASFRDYWTAEGKVFHQVQWEQKFARHLASQPSLNRKANATGGNHAEFRYNPGDQRSYYEQFTEWERQSGGQSAAAGVGALGADDKNLRPAVDCQEWQSSIGPMDGAGQFDDE
ncbi:DnaT-like ssDNA-binding domain-containing protein [Serratia marcescens]